MKRATLCAILMLLGITSTAQNLIQIDLYYSSDNHLLIEESVDELQIFIENEISNFDKPELILEAFPNQNKSDIHECVNDIGDILAFHDLKANKLIHYQKEEHLYFDQEQISDWNFIRLKCSPSKEEAPALSMVNQKVSPTTKSLVKLERNEISATTSTTLSLKKGTIVEIPANSFVYENGEVYTGKVNIVTDEILTIADAILSDATTNIGEQYLESKGMVSIEAFDSENIKLQLAEGKSIAINIPTESESIDSEYGIYQAPVNNDSLEWTLDASADIIPIEIQNRTKYRWKKISAEEQNEIDLQRDEYLAKWDERNLDRSLKRKRLKRARERNRKLISRAKKNQTKVTKSKRNHEKVSRSMILAKTKYRWHKEPLDIGDINRYFRFPSRRLGINNIDKIFQLPIPGKKIVVKNKEDEELRLVFVNNFIFIEGKKKDKKTKFKNIPANVPLILLSTKIIDKNTIEFGYKQVTTESNEFEINNVKTYSLEEYKEIVRKLIGRSQ